MMITAAFTYTSTIIELIITIITIIVSMHPLAAKGLIQQAMCLLIGRTTIQPMWRLMTRSPCRELMPLAPTTTADVVMAVVVVVGQRIIETIVSMSQ